VAAAIELPERRARRSCNVIRAMAALALISASSYAAATSASTQEPKLSSTASWWEKVTVTIAGDGKTQSCRYETSLRADASQNCDVVGGGAAASMAGSHGSAKDEFTRLTFERRFHPGAAEPADGSLEPGDTLLGRQVMSLAIDGAGAVKGCKVVATSGDMTPDYGCDEASAEHFEAGARTQSAAPRQGYMTVIVYGHAEHVV
jgi:hypothetical protein